MNTRTFGALAACVAVLAVLLCVLLVVLNLPMPLEIVMIVAAVLLLATAGVLIDVAVAGQKQPKA